MSVRFRWLLAALLAALTACGGAAPADEIPASTTGCPGAPGPIRGALVFGDNNNLFAIDPEGGAATQITKAGAGEFAYEPAWSPDGQTLAYTMARPAKDPDLAWLPIGVICGIDQATGQGRLLAESGEANVSLTEASWTPDSRGLLVTTHTPLLNDSKQYLGDQMAIAGIDLDRGARQSLITDAFSPALSPDGQRIAYLRIDSESLGVTLMIARSDGSSPQPLPAIDPPLGLVVAPRWSPDSQRLLFTASGGATGTAAPPELALWERLLGITVARAHGLPADVFLFDLAPEQPQLRQLTQKGLDDPRVAWSPDGRSIAWTHGLGGVYSMQLATGEERTITEQGNFGGISWAAR